LSPNPRKRRKNELSGANWCRGVVPGHKIGGREERRGVLRGEVRPAERNLG